MEESSNVSSAKASLDGVNANFEKEINIAIQVAEMVLDSPGPSKSVGMNNKPSQV